MDSSLFLASLDWCLTPLSLELFDTLFSPANGNYRIFALQDGRCQFFHTYACKESLPIPLDNEENGGGMKLDIIINKRTTTAGNLVPAMVFKISDVRLQICMDTYMQPASSRHPNATVTDTNTDI